MLSFSRFSFIRYLFILVLPFATAYASQEATVQDVFDVTSEQTLYTPNTVAELQELVKIANQENKKISIVGTGKSQGGQTMSNDDEAYRISLCNLNKLLALDTRKKLVTVQTGMTWHLLQEYLAPHRLSVRTMQSFNDFSIGGSLGVNVHGQDFNSGPLIQTVESFKLLLADGNIVNVSRTENKELFGLVIGGYGLIGIIVEVTLHITDDVIMKRVTNAIKADELGNYFFTHVKNNPLVQFYSARFSLEPACPLRDALVVTYENTDIQDQKLFDFKPTSLSTEMLNAFLRRIGLMIRDFSLMKKWRFALEKYYFEKPKMISRNNFMGYSIKSLPQDTKKDQYILQEYFIPYEHLNEFVACLSELIREYDINLLNLTARHIPRDIESVLSFTPNHDACALVLFLHVKKTEFDRALTIEWTQALIDKALDLKGTYYLPYALLAEQQQFHAAYPKFQEFAKQKHGFDPQGLFTNKLFEQQAVIA